MAFKNTKTAPSNTQPRPKAFNPFSAKGQKRTAHLPNQVPEEKPSPYPEVRALEKQRKRKGRAAAVAGGTIGGLILGPAGLIFGAIASKHAAEESAKKKEEDLTAEIENHTENPVAVAAIAA